MGDFLSTCFQGPFPSSLAWMYWDRTRIDHRVSESVQEAFDRVFQGHGPSQIYLWIPPQVNRVDPVNFIPVC